MYRVADIVCACAILFVACLRAEESPQWVTAAGRQSAYPDSTWLVSHATESVANGRDRDKCLEIVNAAAQAELARSIRVRIEAESESRQSETTMATASRCDSYFAHRSRTHSDLILVGRCLDSWFDARTNTAHALSAIERATVAEQARERAAVALIAVYAASDAAKAAETDHPADALAQWGRVLTQIQAAESDLSLALIFGRNDPATTEVAQRCQAIHARTGEALARLAERPVTTVDDLAFVLAAQLGRAAGAVKPKVLVPPCTVASSRLSSPLGRYLGQALATQVPAASGWPVVTAAVPGPARDVAAASGADAVVLGTTWERPEGVRVLVTVNDLKDGRLVATAEATLPTAALVKAGLSAAPQNVAAALADQQQFRRDEVSGGALRLELWTSKGDDAPVFLAGEIARIFVRVDRPVHLRIVNHLSDGRRVLLIDDLYLDESKVNLVYQIPGEFEVGAPFGAETIQANASTVAFPRLATRQEDGYAVITESLASANAKTRGFKKVDPATKPELAEARVVVTTMNGK